MKRRDILTYAGGLTMLQAGGGGSNDDGLAIVKAAALRLKGSVSLSKVNGSTGLCVKVLLPKMRA